MAGWLRNAVLAGLLGAGLGQAWAQGAGIYTCIDGTGRRITSDRLIPECSDREQKLMNSSGGVRAVVPPQRTAREREARAEEERRQAEEKSRQAGRRRAERALVSRYPNQGVHDVERGKALEGVQVMTASAQRQIEELTRQKKKLDDETEFYQGDPAKYPLNLKRLIEENEQQLAAQRRRLAAHENERKRVNARFDEELARLKMLWAGGTGVTDATPKP